MSPFARASAVLAFACATLATAIHGGAAEAKEIAVAPADGRGDVLAAALRAAADGDTIRVAKGVYREAIVVDKRVAIVGEPGAVLDPSRRLHPEWRPAEDVGRGAYRARVDRKPAALLVGGRVVAEVDERRAGGDGPWSWRKLLARGGPRRGFTHLRGAWVYRAADKAVLVHLADDADPAPLDWSAVWTADAVVSFRGGADGASVTGLTISGGSVGVECTDGARGCAVTNCTIGPWDRAGVVLRGGASDCRVERNTISRGSLEDFSPGDGAGDTDAERDRYEVWQLHKLAGFRDRIGVNVFRAGAGNRIIGNRIYETFDGINVGDYAVESLDKPLDRPDDGKGTEIAENLIERTRDSGIELGGGCVDVRVHHNTLRRTHGGLRFKVPRVGPVFIYRNVLEGGAPFNVWYSMDDSPAEGYVYHNTIVGGTVGVAYSSFEANHGIGAPNWHYVNNLVVARRGFFQDRRTKAPVNFTAAHNVVAGGGRPWREDDAVRDRGSRYVENLELAADLHPATDCAAIDAGLDLSTYLGGRPLPGCERGSFKGAAPDAGAHEVR